MNFREDTDRMIAFCQYTGFCHMIAFFVNVFCVRAFRAIPDNAESLEFITIRLYDITVIDVDDRFIRNPFADNGEIRV